jgi:hypothetical protein
MANALTGLAFRGVGHTQEARTQEVEPDCVYLDGARAVHWLTAALPRRERRGQLGLLAETPADEHRAGMSTEQAARFLVQGQIGERRALEERITNSQTRRGTR